MQDSEELTLFIVSILLINKLAFKRQPHKMVKHTLQLY